MSSYPTMLYRDANSAAARNSRVDETRVFVNQKNVRVESRIFKTPDEHYDDADTDLVGVEWFDTPNLRMSAKPVTADQVQSVVAGKDSELEALKKKLAEAEAAKILLDNDRAKLAKENEELVSILETEEVGAGKKKK